MTRNGEPLAASSRGEGSSPPLVRSLRDKLLPSGCLGMAVPAYSGISGRGLITAVRDGLTSAELMGIVGR
jgi:hypothetical protein